MVVSNKVGVILNKNITILAKMQWGDFHWYPILFETIILHILWQNIHGIWRKYSFSYSSHYNGVVEKKIMHIVEITCVMLNEKNLPNYFWAKAITTIIYIMNWAPTTAVHGMTPEEKFIGKKPDVSHLKVFGCIAYMHVLDKKRSKVDPKVEKCIFIKYSLEQKGYRCFNPSTQKL